MTCSLCSDCYGNGNPIQQGARPSEQSASIPRFVWTREQGWCQRPCATSQLRDRTSRCNAARSVGSGVSRRAPGMPSRRRHFQ